MDKLKLIKIIVFSLTFLLIFGTLTFLGLFVKKTRAPAVEIPTEISLKQPEGSLIKQIQNHNNQLYLLVIGGGESDRVIIFNTNSGQTISTLKIN